MGKKTRRRRARAGKSGNGVAKRDLRVALEGLELAKGYDGPLRGKPEPALLVAVYGQEVGSATDEPRGPGPARLLGRSLVRFVVGDTPGRCSDPTSAPIQARLHTPARLLLLVTVFEEDGGDDIATSYARCDDLSALSIWDGPSEIPEPHAISDLFTQDGWAPAGEAERLELTPVQLLAGGQDLGDSCKDDGYIGSVAKRVELNGATDRLFRARVVSADGRNDWTALLRLQTK